MSQRFCNQKTSEPGSIVSITMAEGLEFPSELLNHPALFVHGIDCYIIIQFHKHRDAHSINLDFDIVHRERL